MIGTHANELILDAYVKGITGPHPRLAPTCAPHAWLSHHSVLVGCVDFDVQAAFQGMRAQATEANRPHISREGLDEYMALGCVSVPSVCLSICVLEPIELVRLLSYVMAVLGLLLGVSIITLTPSIHCTDSYVPSDDHSVSVSLTLEYAFDDWAVGVLAGLLGNASDSAYFLARSKNYRNVWNSTHQFMCPRNTVGDFACEEFPAFHSWMFTDSAFCEGDQEEWRSVHDRPASSASFALRRLTIIPPSKFPKHAPRRICGFMGVSLLKG